MKEVVGFFKEITLLKLAGVCRNLSSVVVNKIFSPGGGKKNFLFALCRVNVNEVVSRHTCRNKVAITEAVVFGHIFNFKGGGNNLSVNGIEPVI